MPTFATIHTLYDCACTPGPLRVSPPRQDACLQLLDIGLLVFGANTLVSASVRKGHERGVAGDVIDLTCGSPLSHWPMACGAGAG